MDFDRDEGSEFLRLIGEPATLFPLTIDQGLPTGSWGTLEPGDKVQAPDPRQGYGIACGARSGGLVVVDVDEKDGKSGGASLAALEARWGALPPTLSVGSPSGGRHLYFRHPGKFQSNVGKIGPGLDIRAEGGYVRIPGSPHPRHPGRFELIRPLRPAMLPPRWADNLPRAGSTVDAPAPEAQEHDPDELRAQLAATAKGRRGPLWGAWRAIARGERFVRVRGGSMGPELPENFGGIDDFLQALLRELATSGDPWPTVSPADFVALIGPSLGILGADDRAAGNKAYSEADLGGKWSRTLQFAARAKAEQESGEAFVADLVESLQGTMPLIVNYTGAFYVRPALPGPARYVGPKLARDLWLTCRDLWADDGPDVYRETAKGGLTRMTTDDLAERFGRSVDRVTHDTACTEPRIEERALVLPCAEISAEPVFHKDVARWVAAYSPTGHLADWIAVVTDLRYAAPALWLTGEGGIGKSLLAAGLARIWGASPTPMAKAFAEFNDAILRCPLVEAAEELPRNYRGFQDTEKLKDLITETERKINEKHKPIRDVLGAVRVILSSNNTNLIRNASDLTAEDAGALAARFVHLHVTAEHAARIRGALPAPRTIQDHWINGGRIAEHALWLAQTRKVPFGPRLRMAPHSESLRRLFITQPGAGFGVCAAAYGWMLQAARAVQAGQSPPGDGITWHAGQVCTTAHAIRERIPEDVKRPSRRAVSQALQRFAPGGERLSVRLRGAPAKLWPVDLDAVRTWVDAEGWGDPDALEQAAAVLNGAGQ